jgi:hypothetical protein
MANDITKSGEFLRKFSENQILSSNKKGNKFTQKNYGA